jgi:hypothetical protein
MIKTLEQTDLFKELVSKCGKGEANPLDADILIGRVKDAASSMGDVLNRACINFPDYTLHDKAHALRVTLLMGKIMGSGVLQLLTPVELALLILSAYGHDLGMALGRVDRERLQQAPAYRDFLLRHEGRWLDVEQARERGDAGMAEYLSSRLFQEFLREHHHEFSATAILNDYSQLLLVEDKSLANAVALLCKSHGHSVQKVSELKPVPFAIAFKVDMVFLACVLRLADYLDLDSSRAPQSLLDLIQPETEESRREWRKHQAVNFHVTQAHIEFQAQFNDFFEEKALRDTLDGIDRERRECMELLRSRQAPDDRKLMLQLQEPVKADIESLGYRFERFRFRLEYREIMSLLMGTHLYKDEKVFIRELIQNALDACRHSEAAAIAAGRSNYSGKITIRRYEKDGGMFVEVSDNGAGMTRAIIRDYFMQVGRSYYRSFAFRRKGLAMTSVSQFGIGVLSCFMVGDYMEVETTPDPVVYGDEMKDEPNGIKLEIRGPHEFFVVRDLEVPRPGTTVRVMLRKQPVQSLENLVRYYVARIPYKVVVEDQDKPPVEIPPRPFDFSDERFASGFVAAPDSFGYARRDLSFDGKFGLEVSGRIRFFMLEANNRRHLELHNAGRYSFVGFTPIGEAFVNSKQLTPQIQDKFNSILNKIRQLQPNFSTETQHDVANVVRRFNRLCNELVFRYDPDEVTAIWNAVRAEVEALKSSSAFRSNPACTAVEKLAIQAETEIESFVTGRMTLSSPVGILTQDGIELSFFHLPPILKLGIGYLFNLDLCGEHRVSLNAARDNVLRDEKLNAFLSYMYQRIGAFLGEWFAEEEIPDAHLQAYMESVPPVLAMAVDTGLKTALGRC